MGLPGGAGTQSRALGEPSGQNLPAPLDRTGAVGAAGPCTHPREAGDGQAAGQESGEQHPRRERWPNPAGRDGGRGRGGRGAPELPQAPSTVGSGPALTCAAARTFWFKLLPWRGSGGPVNAARHEERFLGDFLLPKRGRNSDSGRAQPQEQPQGQEQRWALCRAGLSLPAPRRAARCPRCPAPRPVTCSLADEGGVPLQLQDELGGALGARVQQDLQHLPRGLGGETVTPQPSRGAWGCPTEPHTAP